MQPQGQSDPYTYHTPEGYGDTFFIYAFDADSLTNGTTVINQRIPILDGDFIVRYVSGLDTVASGIQIRDRLSNPWFGGNNANGAASLFALLGGFGSGWPVLPEKQYPQDGYISFDLSGVAKKAIGVEGGVTTFASQLCFYGVRRRKGTQSDPTPSAFPYYEKQFTLKQPIDTSFQITNFATVGGVLQGGTLQVVFVPDYDFVLHGIRVVQTSGTLEDPTPTFKIWLYNGNKELVSNLPIITQRLVGFNPNNAPERNYWPTPPLLYRANSTIQFETRSLLLPPSVLPFSYDLEFLGMRRYPCK